MNNNFYGGSIRMIPDVKNKKTISVSDEDFDSMFDEGYPHIMPKVYLEGHGEAYFPQYCFDWDDDSVVLVRDKHVLKYTRSSFVELLAKNEELAMELFEDAKKSAMDTYNHYKNLAEKCDF